MKTYLVPPPTITTVPPSTCSTVTLPGSLYLHHPTSLNLHHPTYLYYHPSTPVQLLELKTILSFTYHLPRRGGNPDLFT
eukprot:712865-Hanusia_phi.AAC.1